MSDPVVSPTRSLPNAGPSPSAIPEPASAPLSPTRSSIPWPLRRWQRYQIVELLGTGGMGAVYRAQDQRLNRSVALKIIHPSLGQPSGAANPALVRRFHREARLQAGIEHPHICKVYEIGEVPGWEGAGAYPYIAMQLIDGQPLSRAAGELSLFDKVRVIQQVAEALHEAHRQGLIHRDIKPSNILLSRRADGVLHPYVLDFGLARDVSASDHSRSGVIEGTPRYMAPEQARADTAHLDRRTDVYALGVTLYELLLGQSPYQATSEADLLIAVLSQDPRPPRSVDPNIPADLEAIVLKCIEKAPSARYDSAKALAEDLGRYLSGDPVLAHPFGPLQRLGRRLRKQKALWAFGSALVFFLLFFVAYGIHTQLANRERDRLAKLRAEQAERLGQEITNMEWLLRSARQRKLHDLRQETALVRARMAALQGQLAGADAVGRPLLHYALGRGHLALHEYPQALAQLQQAMQLGNQRPEVHYALGLALGKQFEHAMHEARLSGGGDWARKQLNQIAPRYLQPAISALEHSRGVATDSPDYLEALIAYYKKEYDVSINRLSIVRLKTPWLYEADQLAGDIYLSKALDASDRGQYETAETHFSAAVEHYDRAASEGRSDAQVYERLAEAWVRQVELAVIRSQPSDVAYQQALQAADKIRQADPDNLEAPLKQAFAASLSMVGYGAGKTQPERVQRCLDAAGQVLRRSPDHPYAAEIAAVCQGYAAEESQKDGRDPAPFLQKWIAQLEPVIEKHPRFLWGLNDLSNGYYILGTYQALHGAPSAKASIQRALNYNQRARQLDPTYINSFLNALAYQGDLVPLLSSESDLTALQQQARATFDACIGLNAQHAYCPQNYADVLVRVAQHRFDRGADPRPLLHEALGWMETAHRLGGTFLDAEQYMAQARLLAARDAVRRRQDPGPSLLAASGALARCLSLAAHDALCLSLAPQHDWVQADWLAASGGSPRGALEAALRKADRPSLRPGSDPAGWFVLASTHLRLARLRDARSAVVEDHIRRGLSACQALLQINPAHAAGQAALAALSVLHAQRLNDPAAKQHAIDQAHTAASRCQQHDPFQIHACHSLVPTSVGR